MDTGDLTSLGIANLHTGVPSVRTKTPLKSDKVVVVDCDDTLVMWDLSRYPDLPTIELDCWGAVKLRVNPKNVNLVRKLAKLGYTIIIWSQTGWEWAEAVAKGVGLYEEASMFLTKPRYHVDDLPSSVWMGPRLWRHPVTGNEQFDE